jgi:hypothetical protein
MSATDTTSGQAETVDTSGNLPAWLMKMTFAIQHNPNCPRPFLVRLPGFHVGALDMKTYYGPAEGRTKDALGFGTTAEEAAHAALAIIETARDAFRAEMAEAQRIRNEQWQRLRVEAPAAVAA